MKDHITYTTSGTCSRKIDIEIENGIVTDVKFLGGCSGNTQGVAGLVRGMKIDDIISRLDGIRCGAKGTSCPDQLARALKQYKNGKKESV